MSGKVEGKWGEVKFDRLKAAASQSNARGVEETLPLDLWKGSRSSPRGLKMQQGQSSGRGEPDGIHKT
ncbi:hypothetical protein Pmani_016996 [Petrolisthes manimaculis]|uniref:Uncharacterized protein n=1 Tax=Petrolisthes manimaculis TaxID=1843537 RepID=A0AAE1PQL1_9EUCA|nr:hypothetical protein Pmani_016996 [Petrolisthes manimaculis]